MARRLRVEYPGALYHVMNRGNRREPVFRDDRDRQRFVETLGEACHKTGWKVQAWCLMSNHFHLVVETPRANLVAGMKWLLGTYTMRFNRRHKLIGHLFGGRYRALIVDGSGSGYLRTVCDYVHLNPARAGLVAPTERLRNYRWSSYRVYLQSPGRRPEWLDGERLLGEMGIPKDSPAGRRQFENIVEQRWGMNDARMLRILRRDWCLGEARFRRELAESMGSRMGRHHGGYERHETAEVHAERILAEELRRRRWTRFDLESRRKGDPEKVTIAGRLRGETTMTLDWIAQRLAMGTSGYLANCLRCGARKCRM